MLLYNSAAQTAAQRSGPAMWKVAVLLIALGSLPASYAAGDLSGRCDHAALPSQGSYATSRPAAHGTCFLRMDPYCPLRSVGGPLTFICML
jgi:hypothetical protein